MKIVDTHVHTVIDNPKYARNLSVEELIEKMDAAGIGKAVIVQSQSGNGMDNPYPSDSAKRFPGRLIAIGGGDPNAADAADVLRRRVRDWGTRGHRFFSEGWNPADTRYDPIYAAAAELGIPLLVAGKARFADLRTALARHPKLRIVIDHLGSPDMHHGVPADMAALADRPNVVLKFSTHLLAHAEKDKVSAPEFFGALVKIFGAERLMWGSNYPADHEPRWPYQGTIDAAKALVAPFSAAEQERMLSGTAIALWPELGR